MPLTLDPPALTVDRLQEAVGIRRRIDQLELRLRALFSARRESKRNSYGFSSEEMGKIGAKLHARAKERITNGRSKAFTGSIEEIYSARLDDDLLAHLRALPKEIRHQVGEVIRAV